MMPLRGVEAWISQCESGEGVLGPVGVPDGREPE